MFFRRWNAVVALSRKPGLVLKATLVGACAGTLAGAAWGGMHGDCKRACAAGQYILDHAIDYKCTASGNPCPHYGEFPETNPLKLNCYGNSTAEALLNKEAVACYSSTPFDYAYLAVSTTVGFFVGSFIGFVAGVERAINRLNGSEASEALPTSRSPLVNHSSFASSSSVGSSLHSQSSDRTLSISNR